MRPSSLALACVAVAAAATAQAFMLPPCGGGPARVMTTTMTSTSMRAEPPSPSQSRQQPPRKGSPPRVALDRRHALQEVYGAGAAALLGVSLLSVAGAPAPAAAKAKEPSGPSFEECLATLLLAKKVLGPVKKYINIGQFDPARSNINYVKNQFRIKKAMERAVLLAFDRDVDPAKLDEAAEVTAVVDNEFVQLDSSVYTQIFIPSDGELNPSAVKYRDQAFGFYDTVMKSIDVVLALGGPAELAAAEKLAAPQEKALPDFLFKEFKGEFYRPATP